MVYKTLTLPKVIHVCNANQILLCILNVFFVSFNPHIILDGCENMFCHGNFKEQDWLYKSRPRFATIDPTLMVDEKSLSRALY